MNLKYEKGTVCGIRMAPTVVHLRGKDEKPSSHYRKIELL